MDHFTVYGNPDEYPKVFLLKMPNSWGLLPQWQYVFIESEESIPVTGHFDYDAAVITEITPEIKDLIQSDIDSMRKLLGQVDE